MDQGLLLIPYTFILSILLVCRGCFPSLNLYNYSLKSVNYILVYILIELSRESWFLFILYLSDNGLNRTLLLAAEIDLLTVKTSRLMCCEFMPTILNSWLVVLICMGDFFYEYTSSHDSLFFKTWCCGILVMLYCVLKVDMNDY